MKRAIPGLLLVLIALTVLLCVSHARPAANDAICLDELLIRWNEFANDANRHVQTFEANAGAHEKAHRKLDREYAALKALACW